MNGRFLKVISSIAGCIVVVRMLCACAAVTGLPEPQVTSLMNVPPEKTLIVGRIELHPPLKEGEQVLRSALGEEFKNVFILYCGDRLRDFKASRPDSFAGSFSTTLDKEFFIKVDKGRTLFISGGTYYTVYDPPFREEDHTFSSPFQVELRPDDEAVYIGTIQYYRDEANSLKSITIRDDYQWADSRFKDRFGTSKSLRKALVTPAPCAN